MFQRVHITWRLAVDQLEQVQLPKLLSRPSDLGQAPLELLHDDSIRRQDLVAWLRRFISNRLESLETSLSRPAFEDRLHVRFLNFMTLSEPFRRETDQFLAVLAQLRPRLG